MGIHKVIQPAKLTIEEFTIGLRSALMAIDSYRKQRLTLSGDCTVQESDKHPGAFFAVVRVRITDNETIRKQRERGKEFKPLLRYRAFELNSNGLARAVAELSLGCPRWEENHETWHERQQRTGRIDRLRRHAVFKAETQSAGCDNQGTGTADCEVGKSDSQPVSLVSDTD